MNIGGGDEALPPIDEADPVAEAPAAGAAAPAAAAAAGAGRPGAARLSQWQVPGGTITLNAGVLIATCGCAEHKLSMNPCRLQRTVSPKGNAPKIGRPLGFLLSWLQLQHCGRHPFQEPHTQAACRKGASELDKSDLDVAARMHWRQYLKDNGFDDLLACERPCRLGEPDECVPTHYFT